MSGHDEQVRLAFLTLLPTAKEGGYIGAVLVTDRKGVPLEFRCTHSIHPTVVQRSLYGQALAPHVGVELCGKPLLKSLSTSPSLVVVQSRELVDLREAVREPVVYFERAGEKLEISDDGGSSRSKKLVPASGRFQALMAYTHPDYDEDLATATEIIQSVSEHLDPTEPFKRIEEAVAILAEQDPAYA